MDEVTELRNLSGHYPFSNFMYVPNPEFEEFKDGIKYFQQKSEYLTINVSIEMKLTAIYL